MNSSSTIRLHTIAEPSDLAILTAAVEGYCVRHGVVAALDRENVASRAFHLFQQGIIEPDDLTARMERGSI